MAHEKIAGLDEGLESKLFLDDGHRDRFVAALVLNIDSLRMKK